MSGNAATTKPIMKPLLVGLCLYIGCDTAPPPVRFRDVTTQSGIDFVHVDGASGAYFLIETYGAGGGFFDSDGDGDLDIYLVNGFDLGGIQATPVNLDHRRGGTYWVERPDQVRSAEPGAVDIDFSILAEASGRRAANVLYRNNGDGSFSDISRESGVDDTGYGMGCAAADYDNDGDQDLYVTNYGPNVLYRNEGDGTFTNVTDRAGVAAPQWSSSAAFFDYDGDGHLDLYVVNNVDFTFATNKVCGGFVGTTPLGLLAITERTRSYCAPSDYGGVPDALYRNDGDGTFTDISAKTGIADLAGKGLGVVAWDFDGDGDQDVFVANDGMENYLYRNEGDGTFTDVALQVGAAFNADGDDEACMGVDFGDYDNDGDFDLFVTNFSHETNTLYRNEGGRFKDVTDAVGLGRPSWRFLGFGTNFLDYDNDGDLDLYVANGHVLDKIALFQSGVEYAQEHQLFLNDGTGRFALADTSSGAWFALAQVGRGTAFGDYDGDGDIDILATNGGGAAKLVRNEGGNAHNWLMVRTEGTQSNRDGVGTQVKVVAGDLVQVRQVRSGSSYLSISDPRLHFGLGTKQRVDLVEVRWTSGMIQRIEDIPVNQVLSIKERWGL